MKRPTTILHRMLLDEALQVGLTIERDYRVICSRFKDEGMSFLTITLPTLSKALEKGLETGRITRSDFPGFKPVSRSRSLPALLSGFFMRVFDLDGCLLSVPCIASIRAIRQVSRAFSKVRLPCSSARVKRAFERYKTNDEGLSEFGFRCPSDAGLWASVVGYLWSDLESLSGELYCFPGVFGSGATAERKRFNERHSVLQWPSRSEPWFPSDFHATHDFGQSAGAIQYLPLDSEQPVRVVQVPKTLKTPRVISVEPSYMMLMQQSIAKPLMAYLESPRFPFKSIRFSSQEENRSLARISSSDRSLATIDLSDASDLVSLDLVRNTFGGVAPSFLELIEGCRSRTAKLPGEKKPLLLKKFASQGSACCFPVEAMVFFTIVLFSMVKQSGRSPSLHLLRKLAKDVAVYGDDMIVPVTMVSGVMDDLEAFGLRVNRDKSFVTGYFRESCGGDYYKGVDVTPTYVRLWDFSGKLGDVSQIIAYVQLSNQLYVKGMWHASQCVRDLIDKSVRHIPYSTRDVGCITYASVFRNTGLRYRTERSGYSVYGIVPRTVDESESPSDLKGFLLRAFSTRDHTERMGSARGSFRNIPLGEVWDPSTGRSAQRPLTGGTWADSTIEEGPTSYIDEFGEKLSSQFFPRFGDVTGADILKLRTSESSLNSSVRPYVLKSKRRWTPTPVGLIW